MRPSLTVRLLAPLLVLGFAVGCSDDDSADPDPSSTTSAPTTAIPGTSTTYAPVALSYVIGGQGLLGWWEGGRWLQAQTSLVTPVEEGDEVRLVRLDGSSSAASVTGVKAPEEFCGAPQVDLDPAFPDPTGGVEHLQPVAVHGVEDPQPRPATLLDTDAAVYRDAAREVLVGLAIHDDADPELAQVVRADLSGDGTDEVLVVAEKLARPESAQGEPGDYSVLFLRQIVDGAVRTTVLDSFYKDPAEEVEEPSIYILVYRVSGIVDLNGDGVLEVVTENQYYEGSSTAIRALQPDGTLTEVMAAGCGV